MGDPAGPGAAREWNARSYDRVGGHMARRGAGVLERIALEGSEHVLDAGCGTGRVTGLLRERLPSGRVIALDGSRTMLAEAKARLGEDRIDYVLADLTEPLPLTAPVDLIVSTSTLHWVPEHDEVFARFWQALRPGGRLVVDCGGAGNIAGVRDAIRAAGVDWSPWNFRSAAEARTDLEAAGFASVDTWLSSDPLDLDPSDLPEYLRTVILGSHLARMAPDEKDGFVGRVAKAMPAPHIDYVRLNIEAIRPTE